MAVLIGVISARQGVGATTRAVSLAYQLARTRSVLLADLDGAGGTVCDLLALDPGGRGVANLYAANVPSIPVAALEEQAIRVPRRERLRVVPSVREGCGPEPAELVPMLSGALQALPDDVVIADLGAALAYPGMRSPWVVGQALARSFPRLVIVMNDDMYLSPIQIQVVRNARLPHAEVIMTTRSRSEKRRRPPWPIIDHGLNREVRRYLDRVAPDLVVQVLWPWQGAPVLKPMACDAFARQLSLL